MNLKKLQMSNRETREIWNRILFVSQKPPSMELSGYPGDGSQMWQDAEVFSTLVECVLSYGTSKHKVAC